MKEKRFLFSKANQLLKNKIKMNKFLALLAVLVLLFSCKSKAIVTKPPLSHVFKSKIIEITTTIKRFFHIIYKG
jgi:ACR3 family arsenite efflux pump ArsB